MSLPQPAPRRELHTRTVVSKGFLRDDGLWDIEGELRDVKSYGYDDRERGVLAPGMPMHLMRARLTIDDDMVVREVHTDMAEIPFRHCSGATVGAPALVGASLGPGWRRAVDAAMKGVKGCSHMRELMYAMATTAFQTVSCYREQFVPAVGAPRQADGKAPFFLDQCHSWAATSPVVARYFPLYFRQG